MSEKIEIVEIDRFKTIDQNGQQHIVIAFQNVIVSESHSGTSRISGTKFMRTEDGDEVIFGQENTFELVRLGLRLKKT